MKTVYILSEGFAPRSAIGGIRCTKIAKYLSKAGYRVIVFTKGLADEQIDKYGEDDIETIGRNRGMIIRSGNNHFWGVSKLVGFFNKVGANYLGRFFYSLYTSWNYKNYHVKNLKNINLPRPDVIISTYGSFGGHYLAIYLKILYKNAIWIADFRDSVYGIAPKGKWLYGKYANYFMQKVVLAAEYITAINDAILEEMAHLKGFNPNNAFKIMNGFDSEDYEKISKEYNLKVLEDKFILSYGGLLYSDEHKRDMQVAFLALNELILEGKMVLEDIEVHYAGPQFDLFEERIPDGISPIRIIDHGYIPRNEVLLLQQRSAILLFPSQNIIGEQVITGKIFEYFMAKRPILGIIEGTVKNSISKKMLQDSRCGFCYETANHEEDYQGMKEFILLNYHTWKSGDRPMPEYCQEYISQFDWKNNVKNFEGLFDKR